METNELRPTQSERLSALYQALAPAVFELDEAGTVVFMTGSPEDVMGINEACLLGQPLADFLHDKDMPVWELVRHRLRKSKHVGPFPLRLNPARCTRGAFDLVVARSDTPGHLLVAVSLYQGNVSLGESKRPASSLARQFEKEDFTALAKRLTSFVSGKTSSVAEALISLAGMGKDSQKIDAETSLWTLYRLLFDAASEQAAAKLSAEKREKFAGESRQDEAAEALETIEASEAQGATMERTVRSAYRKEARETNYVTVAGEDGISESEAVKAAVYAMKQAASSEKAKTMQALTGGYEKRLETVKNQLRLFKKIVMQEHFDVALQPIVTLADGKLHHFEALARFDQKFYTGSPFEFMHFAENVGVIHEFDLAMAMKVVTLIKRMRRIGYNLAIAVNISGHSIQSQAFLRHFFRILEDCGDIRSNLMFELTESSQIEDLEGTNRVLSRIRDFGHKVALDDFGAGAAGLQYLRVLQVDCVKIDGIYIRKGIEDTGNRSFLKSMTDLCSGLNIETVGECVETEGQRQFLLDLGVTYAQGWLYGKPLPVDEALKIFVDS